jgi:hypothetical protein
MMCGALYPPAPPKAVPPPAAVAAQEANKSSSIEQPGPSAEQSCLQSSAAAIAMLHPPQWLPSEISMLHLGSGWSGHGGSVERLPSPSPNFSDPLRSRCAHLPTACQAAAPLSWSPLEDERLAIEAALAAEVAAAALAEATQRNKDAERRAAAKKRLQLAGAQVAQGLGRDIELSPQNNDNHGHTLHDSAAPVVGAPQEAEVDESFAIAGGALSVVEVGSFSLEGGWCDRCAHHLHRVAVGVVDTASNQVLRQCCQWHAPRPRHNVVQQWQQLQVQSLNIWRAQASHIVAAVSGVMTSCTVLASCCSRQAVA